VKASELVPDGVYAHKRLRPASDRRALLNALGLVRVLSTGHTETEAIRLATGKEPPPAGWHHSDPKKGYAVVEAVEDVRDSRAWRDDEKPRAAGTRLAIAARDIVHDKAVEEGRRAKAETEDARLVEGERVADEGEAILTALLGWPVSGHADLSWGDPRLARVRLTLDAVDLPAFVNRLHKARDVEAALRDLVTAVGLLGQGLRLSGAVTPETPGGQSTATLPDGTPVDRHAYLAEKVAAAKAALS